ncbi:alpha/beta hydrolase [Sphingobacterium pedocola]|uniref:Endo-1,4-beta-xylanase n=1 Tax=Sphingobacterium pedocola TaxID=2082722 RepID=A0ABR9T7B1_9SPHI|nr:alpha/beta hydrolase [Sphingobacterium pedocola]MBE8721228.1 endo-1,4-beta-xylanase [Sphingobacterium pedocola]
MPKVSTYIMTLLFLVEGSSVFSQEEMPLYAGKVPNATNVEQSAPTLTVFLPSPGTASGIAVIVCPGGGYQGLVSDREGTDVAKAYNAAGITAFVLKYRLPDSKTMIDKWKGPLQDAQQAIKTVRENAEKWGVDPSKIGIMGFSAGGHLASTAGTHFDQSYIENKKNTSLRPNFMVLVYPVISFKDGITNVGSRNSLIGPESAADYKKHLEQFSNEGRVTPHTPPTFLTHAADDSLVPVSNATLFYEALRKNGVPADLHLYSRGEHGYLSYPAFKDWFAICLAWVSQQ